MPRLSEIPSYHEKAQNRYVKLMYQMKFGDQEFETAPGNATGVTGNAETVFAHVPDVMEHMLRGFEYYFSSDRILDPLLRELSVVRAAWATGSQFVFSQHSKILRAVGGTEQQISELKSWQVSDVYTDKERAVLAYSDGLSLGGGRVSDGVFDALKRQLSETEIVELTYSTLMYILHSAMVQALRVEYDDRDDHVSEIPAPNDYVMPAPRIVLSDA
jgi:AhpD family alkylhydroperoxidase